jgi:hypothetical protein
MKLSFLFNDNRYVEVAVWETPTFTEFNMAGECILTFAGTEHTEQLQLGHRVVEAILRAHKEKAKKKRKRK